MRFIHDMFPNTTLSKYETLDDENTSSQPNKVDMDSDYRYKNLQRNIIPPCIHHGEFSRCTYTKNLKEVHN